MTALDQLQHRTISKCEDRELSLLDVDICRAPKRGCRMDGREKGYASNTARLAERSIAYEEIRGFGIGAFTNDIAAKPTAHGIKTQDRTDLQMDSGRIKSTW